MRTRPMRVVLYGCGLMGEVIVRYLHEKGAKIVGAIDSNPSLIGRDIGEVSGIAPLGVLVSSDAEVVLDGADADVAILTLLSLMSEMEPFFIQCASRGINAITTCEEAFYPWNTSPEITERLDGLARMNGCTLTGSGYQDVFWGNLVTTLSGATHRIDRITGYSSYNVDEYGISLARVHGVGLSLAEFQKQIAESNHPSFAMNVPPWLASQLGLTPIAFDQKLIPITLERPVYSEALGREIPAGHVIGMNARVTTPTEEGPVIVAEVVGKVYTADQVDHNDWTIEGEPTTTIKVAEPRTVELTCATTVNRLPQVISAPAGFITTEKMERAHYLPGKLVVPVTQQN